MASDVYENTNYSAPVMCQGQSEMVHSDMVMSAQQSEMVHSSPGQSETVHSSPGHSETVHSDMGMSAQTQQNQTAVMSTQTWESEMVHTAANLSTQTQQTQTVAHSNQKHHIVQCHQNLSVKSNKIKKLKSTAFKSCKYHKQLMTIAQTFAEEAADTLKLQYGGVSTNDNLEFADCLKSSGHELNDIGSHLLECAKLIKQKHFGNINRPKDKRKMQARNSPLHSDEAGSSSQPTDQ